MPGVMRGRVWAYSKDSSLGSSEPSRLGRSSRLGGGDAKGDIGAAVGLLERLESRILGALEAWEVLEARGAKGPTGAAVALQRKLEARNPRGLGGPRGLGC